MYPSRQRRDLNPSRLRLAKIGLETTRCRGRQIFGGAKDFCPNLLKLTRKICVSKMIRTLLWKSHKKGLHVYYGEEKSQIQTYFDSQSHHHTMRRKLSKHLCPNFAGFFSVFSEILPGFLTNQSFWGGACTPVHTWPRDQVSRLHHCCSWY